MGISKLDQADEILTELYWNWIDNHEDKKHTQRLDTILGKIRELKEIIKED